MPCRYPNVPVRRSLKQRIFDSKVSQMKAPAAHMTPRSGGITLAINLFCICYYRIVTIKVVVPGRQQEPWYAHKIQMCQSQENKLLFIKLAPL